MRELKTLGALGYWLLTFEVTLPFFDKAGARRDKKIGGAGEKNRSGARDARWIQIIKFDWTELGRGWGKEEGNAGPCVYPIYRLRLAYPPRISGRATRKGWAGARVSVCMRARARVCETHTGFIHPFSVLY